MGFLRSLLGGAPPAPPKETDDPQTRQRYLQWLRHEVKEGDAAHRRSDWARRDAIWARLKAEAIPALTLSEAVEIDEGGLGFLVQGKAASLWKPLEDASATDQIDNLEQEIGRLETIAGTVLDKGQIRSLLRLDHYKDQLRFLKIKEAIRRDALSPLETGRDGTQLFARERAAYRREEGWLTLTDKGVLFEGMVRIEFPWAEVKMIALGGKECDELGFQEGKRRTATRFAFEDPRARERVKAMADWLWKRHGKP